MTGLGKAGEGGSGLAAGKTKAVGAELARGKVQPVARAHTSIKTNTVAL
jgi:hypothetical protein